jgi:O-antigen biosynthesis protein
MKIFCIGLNKTGTSSLHQALQTLGFRSLHLGGPEVPVGIKRATDEGRGLVEYLGDYDAFSDIWRLSERFELLDRQYPGSKFILTIRDLDGWLESRRQHVQRNVLRKAQGHYSGGFLTVDIERWTHEFDEHHARVLDYFTDRPDDLLVMNVARGDGYELLCPFLGVDVPAAPFPWSNRGADWRPRATTAVRVDARAAGTDGPSGPGPSGVMTRVARGAVRRAARLARRGLRVSVRCGRAAVRRLRARAAARWAAARRLPGRPPAGGGARAVPRRVEVRDATRDLDVDATLEHLERLAARPPVTVVVPIHDAYEDLRRCLASLERNTDARDCELLLVDDRSTDRRIAALLEEWEGLGGCRVLRNDVNLGYTRTVNRGIAACSGDVVLLNSDCEVTPRWLQHLIECAYRDAKTATVTAISDNAGAFSVPEIGVANDRPRHLSGDQVGRLVTHTSQRIYPGTPTGNGFCMYIRRAALTELGPFDAEAFPRGYGEEGDFCMRAGNAGWNNVVDDTTIVFHRRSASFGAERHELMRAGRERLDARHSDYTRLIREFVKSDALCRVQANVGHAYASSVSSTRAPRPRVLYVHHRGTGGTPQTNADLMAGLVDDYEPYLLTSDTKVLELSRVESDGIELLERWALPDPVRPEQFTHPAYRAVVADILMRHAIDLVHIRVLLAHGFDLPSVARTLDMPVILSFHDYFLVCPTFHLLDDADRFCGGVCTAGDGACRIPSDWVKGVPHLKHAWVNTWQEAVARLLADCDAFVTTSPAARDIYVRTYPELADAPFHLIEHGRDVTFDPVPTSSDMRDRVRIAIPGSFDVHKGAPFIERLLELDTAGRLEFHFLGKVPDRFRHLGVVHGPYERHDFTRMMRKIRPAFVGIFSIWAETYSHTLSEAWAAGLPVLVTDLGAPKERVEQHGGGWILDHRNPAAAYARILEICGDEAEYERVRSEVGTAAVRPVRAMADDYDRLYRTAFLTRRVAQRRRLPAGGLPRAALFVVGGTSGAHPPTAHIRMLRRLHHPSTRAEVATDVVSVENFMARRIDDPDVAIVQRNAIPPGTVDAFIDELASRGIPLVVDIDDDLLALEPGDGSYREYQSHLTSLGRLVDAADLVTASTEQLRDVMAGRARDVVVVPNLLDEALWFGPTVPAPWSRAAHWSKRLAGRARRRVAAWSAPAPRRRCNLVYVGSRTHAEDLAMLRPVMEQLQEHSSIDFRLLVIGGEPEQPLRDRWYRRVHIPGGFSHYPAFVSWLRSVSGSWHIGVAPLQDTAFNRSKSDLKFLEYAALGLPGVFSDVDPYSRSMRDGATGLLVPNDEHAWCAAILRIAEDTDLGVQMASAARSLVLDERCLCHGASEYVATLQRVLARSTDRGGVPWPTPRRDDARTLWASPSQAAQDPLA